MLALVILISGRGSNMLAIARAAQSGALPVRIAAVVSDRPEAPGLAHARSLGLPTAVVAAEGHPDRASYDAALAATLRRFAPDLVALAGFMRILGPQFVRELSGRLLNIHPSLLPAYRGLHTHRRVLEAGERLHGCSVHFVTDELDGGPLIVQAQVPIEPGDTPEKLSARVQAWEHRIYPEAIEWFAAGRLRWQDGGAWLDGRPLTSPVIVNAATEVP